MRLVVLWLTLCAALQAADAPELLARNIVNAADRSGGRVAPGEIVVLFPINAGPVGLAGAQLDSQGRVTTSLGDTRVWFDGIAAPMSYSVTGDVEAVVPYEIAHRRTTEIVLEYRGVRSMPVTLPVVDSAPALFTLDSSGRGQAAMLNETGCCNSARNPATRGKVAVLYATGEGETNPRGITGSVSAHARVTEYPVPRLPVRVFVGDSQAQILYAGEAPHAVAGLLQVNFRVPANAGLGDAIPIVLAVGKTRSRDGVTMAIRSPVQRIVVVDPAVTTRRRLRLILGGAGYRVSNEPNDSSPIDLAIISLAMPEQERLKAVHAMRAQQPQPRIVAMAEAPGPDAFRAADLLEAQAVLTKSMGPREVLRRVREVLRARSTPYDANMAAMAPH